MHRLTRSPCPACLQRYHHGRHNWDTFHQNRNDVDELRNVIFTMHSGQCAYCESVICADDWHIEHFWPRNSYPQRTFAWSNLFASCNRKESCGTYKDQDGKPYNPAHLIDPTTEDPDKFLLFVANGTVQPRDGLTTQDAQRAYETIRVFNLNAPILVFLREQVVTMLLNSDPGVIEFMNDLPAAERPGWVATFVADYCADGYQTPVRHLLCA